MQLKFVVLPSQGAGLMGPYGHGHPDEMSPKLVRDGHVGVGPVAVAEMHHTMTDFPNNRVKVSCIQNSPRSCLMLCYILSFQANSDNDWRHCELTARSRCPLQMQVRTFLDKISSSAGNKSPLHFSLPADALRKRLNVLEIRISMSP